MKSEKHATTRKFKFTAEEDSRLVKLVSIHGESSWEEISKRMPNRNVRQCHDRWFYYLSPDINTSVWTNKEESKLIEYVNLYGRKWTKIATLFPGRNDVQIKNKWNALKRKYSLENPPKRTARDSEVVQEMINCSHIDDESKSIFDSNLSVLDFPLPNGLDVIFDL